MEKEKKGTTEDYAQDHDPVARQVLERITGKQQCEQCGGWEDPRNVYDRFVSDDQYPIRMRKMCHKCLGYLEYDRINWADRSMSDDEYYSEHVGK